MRYDNEAKLDPIQAQKLKEAMLENAERRTFTTPYVRIRRPWLGAWNWERHKKKLATKRRQHNMMARMSRKVQRRA